MFLYLEVSWQTVQLFEYRPIHTWKKSFSKWQKNLLNQLLGFLLILSMILLVDCNWGAHHFLLGMEISYRLKMDYFQIVH